MKKIPETFEVRFDDFEPPVKKSKRSSKVSESTSSSQPDPDPDLIAIPNLNDFDDPESKKEALRDYFRRVKAAEQPKWLPCPPTASESFLHETPVDKEEEVRPLNDLQLRAIEIYNSVARLYNSEPGSLKRKTIAELANEIDVSSQKRQRRYDAEDFRRSYVYGFNKCMDQKACIWSSGYCTWPEKSYGVMWVAVHGINSICVVTRRSVLDSTCLGDSLKIDRPHVCKLFRETLISEMEDLADPSSDVRETIHHSFDKPFAVVSLIPAGTNKANEESGPEASGAVYDGKRAIDFIREKMGSGSTLTYGYSETLQTAVSAFLLLFDEELKAKDVTVCVLTKGNYAAKQLRIRDAGENLVVMYQQGIETLVERPA